MRASTLRPPCLPELSIHNCLDKPADCYSSYQPSVRFYRRSRRLRANRIERRGESSEFCSAA